VAGQDATFIALAPTSSAAANLGATAGIESRTVASLIAGGGHNLDHRHILVLDEAGQLGSRQALRVLEISRLTGARLIMLGDNKQTGAIEQGKAFWLLQRFGLSTAELTESVRQETRQMKAAVTQARLGNYAASIDNLDKIVSGDDAVALAKGMVGEWTRLKPENRARTNILVLENAMRLIVNAKVRETLKAEGAIAAEEARLSILTPAGMTDQEKHFARFYSGGQVLVFARDKAEIGIARGTEYRVVGTGRDSRGRQIVRLVDEHGRTISWDPRIGRAAHVNVFRSEQRELAAGDRIQWRQVNHELGVKNAERGLVEALDGPLATIRWDRDGSVQNVDLARHKSWDHGYAETVYSAQSKTYDRAYVLAPVRSPLVTGQNYYTAITRARYGVKLWTEDRGRLVEKLERKSGEKTSALEGLGRLARDSHEMRQKRHGERWEQLRAQDSDQRHLRSARMRAEGERRDRALENGLPGNLASRAQSAIQAVDVWLRTILARNSASPEQRGNAAAARPSAPDSVRDRALGPDR
jgi:ATP-dependent exoDNAse (exonuclease V) alpha subunit